MRQPRVRRYGERDEARRGHRGRAQQHHARRGRHQCAAEQSAGHQTGAVRRPRHGADDLPGEHDVRRRYRVRAVPRRAAGRHQQAGRGGRGSGGAGDSARGEDWRTRSAACPDSPVDRYASPPAFRVDVCRGACVRADRAAVRPRADAGRHPARRVRPYRANNDLLYYHLDVRVDPGKEVPSAARTRSASRCSRTTPASSSTCMPRSHVDKILLGDTDAQVRARHRRGLRGLSRDAAKRASVYSHRLLLLRQPGRRPAGSAASPSARIRRARPGFTPPAKAGRQRLVAEQGPVARRGRSRWTSASRFPTTWWTSPTASSWARTTWATATRAGIGTCTIPINNYCVSLNIGNYEHFSDKLGDLPLDFYALPEDLEKAKKQFAQAKGMLEAYQHYFGEYPFKKDGYKLIEVPYSGMEHQSAVTYGNRFKNGYLEPRLDGRRHQPALRLHHHPRKRARVVRQQRQRRRRLRHVDSRRLDDLSRRPVRRVHVGQRRRA